MPCVSCCEQEEKGLASKNSFPFREGDGGQLKHVHARAHAHTTTTTTTFIQEAPSAHTGNSWGQELLPGAGNFPSADPNTLTITHSVQIHTVGQPCPTNTLRHTVKQVAQHKKPRSKDQKEAVKCLQQPKSEHICTQHTDNTFGKRCKKTQDSPTLVRPLKQAHCVQTQL